MLVCVSQVLPYIGVSLYIEVVKVVSVFRLAEVRPLQSLNDLCLHHHRNVGGQQGQQKTLLLVEKRGGGSYMSFRGQFPPKQ